MNTISQPDFHPNAESLNAFVEQVLTEPERLRILSHIASCNRCRQVIFLAQEAASREETPALAMAPAFRPAMLWTSWRFAWVPAAAMAAIVTLAIFLHRPHAIPNGELARVVPQNEVTVPKPSSQVPSNTGAAQSPIAVNLAAKKAPTVFPPETAPSAALPAVAGTVEPQATESQAAALPPGSSEERLERFSAQEAATQFKAETVDAARQSQFANGALASNTATVKISPVRMKSTAGPAPASRNLTVAASAPRLEMKAAPPGSFDRAPQPQKAGVLAPGTPTLPSGLGAVSTAMAQHRTLSIDIAGTLFLSDDAGQHWESVVRQWDGRAVEVRVKPALSSPPTEVFEIVNDHGQIWSSVDGKTWKAN